jgi:sugar phosphate permease
MGGFSDWLPTFFNRYYGMSVENAGFVNGMIVVVGGLSGAVIGGLVTDWVHDHVTRRHPYFLVASVTTLITAVLATIALYCCEGILGLAMVLLGFATFFGWFYCGPINSLLMTCVPPDKRALANGLCILMIHMFGDAISPAVIGLISDAKKGDLRGALFIVPVSFGVSILTWFLGWVFLPTESV